MTTKTKVYKSLNQNKFMEKTIYQLLEEREASLKSLEQRETEEKQEIDREAEQKKSKVRGKYLIRKKQVEGRRDQIIAGEIPKYLAQDYETLQKRSDILEKRTLVSVFTDEERTKAKNMLELIQFFPDPESVYNSVLDIASDRFKEAIETLRSVPDVLTQADIHSYCGECPETRQIIFLFPLDGKTKTGLVKKLEDTIVSISQQEEIAITTPTKLQTELFRFGEYTGFKITPRENYPNLVADLKAKFSQLSNEVLTEAKLKNEIVEVPYGVIEKLVSSEKIKPGKKSGEETPAIADLPYGLSKGDGHKFYGTAYSTKTNHKQLMQAYHRLAILQAREKETLNTTDIGYVPTEKVEGVLNSLQRVGKRQFNHIK